MSEGTQFSIGTNVACSDGACGELTRLIVDPKSRTITHLVVGPRHHGGTARLVPMKFVESADKEIRLACTATEFDGFDQAEEKERVQGAAVGQQFWSSYSVFGSFRAGTSGLPTVDDIPRGEVEVRRGD